MLIFKGILFFFAFVGIYVGTNRIFKVNFPFYIFKTPCGD